VNPNLLLIVLVVAATRLFGLCAYTIPTDFMAPTLQQGDYVLGRRCGASATFERGDLVTFRVPSAGDSEWVRRVIGLPGDRVQIRQGLVYVNGAALEQERAPPHGDGFVEATPEGRHYQILKDNGRRARSDMDDVVVPSGHYFVLGDNRGNAADSRDHDFGIVAREDVVARMYVVYWARSRVRRGTWLD
jgi:signal peptidase I